MQKRFTRQAEEALNLAKKTAMSLNHSYIGTEHILAGLLKEPEGTAGRILAEFGVEEERLTELIRKLVAPPDTVTIEKNAPVQSEGRADS